MTKLRPVAVVGAGGHGREVAWLIEEINAEARQFEFVGFIDDAATATPEGYPLLGSVEAWLARRQSDVELVCAIGEPSTRAAVVARLDRAGARYATLVHPTVRRSRWVEIATGTMICAGSVLTTNVQVGPHAIVNLACTISHDARLGAFCSLMSGVHVSGHVTLGRGVYVGTGASLIQDVTVGDWTVIGAGAVVTSNLPGGQIAVGVPAKAIKPNPRAPGA